MGHKKVYRRLEFKYEFDRLGKQKIEQVYDILLSKVLEEYKRNKEQQLVRQGSKKR